MPHTSETVKCTAMRIKTCTTTTEEASQPQLLSPPPPNPNPQHPLPSSHYSSHTDHHHFSTLLPPTFALSHSSLSTPTLTIRLLPHAPPLSIANGLTKHNTNTRGATQDAVLLLFFLSLLAINRGFFCLLSLSSIHPVSSLLFTPCRQDSLGAKGSPTHPIPSPTPETNK